MFYPILFCSVPVLFYSVTFYSILSFRTKLGVTTAQVEDQKAYIKQLVSTEADPALIQQEKLVEHQLKKRLVLVYLSHTFYP